MKSVIVVDCASSGQMYIDDIIMMGYRPVALYTYFDSEHAEAWRLNVEGVKKDIGDRAVVLQLGASDGLEEIIELVRPLNPVLVVPGSEPGVRLADQLSYAFGLKGNDPETTYLRCNKQGMNEALSRAGVRHIITAEVRSKEEVTDFWNTHCSGKAVMKFSEASGTVGLKICDTLEGCLDYFEEMRTMYDDMGRLNVPVLMQEFIGGTEYIVNSLSVDGQHKITDVWRYHKVVQEDGVIVYDYTMLVDSLGPGMQGLLRYDYAVLDAVQMRNGYCHTEIKIDSKGPVLIETNPRVMGGSLRKEYLDEVFGFHMTDIALKALLEPSFFPEFRFAPYAPRMSTMIKSCILPRDVRADLEPYFEIIRHLDSFREIGYYGEIGVKDYVRTIDLETSPFFVRMTNSDFGRLIRDYGLMRTIEEMYFGLAFTMKGEVAASRPRTDVEKIFSILPPARRFLLVTESGRYVVQYGRRTPTGVWSVYDGAVYTRSDASTITGRYNDLMETMSQVRKGGPFVIVPEVYDNLPYGEVSIETMLSVMGFEAKIPTSSANGIIYGMRR